jgi:hypothetical protein
MRILRVTAPVLTVDPAEAAAALELYERRLGRTARARLRNPAGTLD